jgi:hypothetical protein
VNRTVNRIGASRSQAKLPPCAPPQIKENQGRASRTIGSRGTTVTKGTLPSAVNMASVTTAASLTAASGSVMFNVSVLDDVPAGMSIVLTAAYSAGLAALIQCWLSFPTVPASAINNDSYQPGGDDRKFWPGPANAQPAACLN